MDLGNTITKSKDQQARKWCFTLNNWTIEEFDTMLQHFINKKYKYIIGREGANGTPHLQGYIENKNGIRWSTLRNLNSRWHLEKAKGNQKQNVDYCSKEGDYETNIDIEKDNEKEIGERYLLERGWRKINRRELYNDVLNNINLREKNYELWEELCNYTLSKIDEPDYWKPPADYLNDV